MNIVRRFAAVDCEIIIMTSGTKSDDYQNPNIVS